MFMQFPPQNAFLPSALGKPLYPLFPCQVPEVTGAYLHAAGQRRQRLGLLLCAADMVQDYARAVARKRGAERRDHRFRAFFLREFYHGKWWQGPTLRVSA